MLIDNYSRQINYLRLSITDMCNLRCIYCQPWQQIGKKNHQEILRYEEIIRLVSLMVELGIKRIRVTGGEPLIKKDVLHLFRQLANIELLDELSLTTNATKLAQFAWQLKEVGVKRVNVSLDSLNKNRYFKITGGGNLNEVITGIEEALKAGLVPLKINMVVMKGINDDEIEEFAKLTSNKHLHIRFIEFMPIGQQKIEWKERFLPGYILKEKLDSYFDIISDNGIPGNGPTEYYQIKGAMGKIGFISPISNSFCSRCNRVRITPDGYLRPCLGKENEVDLKQLLRQGTSDSKLKEIIGQSVNAKPEKHNFYLKELKGRQMASIGG